jgi:hypothetical protein
MRIAAVVDSPPRRRGRRRPRRRRSERRSYRLARRLDFDENRPTTRDIRPQRRRPRAFHDGGGISPGIDVGRIVEVVVVDSHRRHRDDALVLSLHDRPLDASPFVPSGTHLGTGGPTERIAIDIRIRRISYIGPLAPRPARHLVGRCALHERRDNGIIERPVAVRAERTDDLRVAIRDARGTGVLLHVQGTGEGALCDIRRGDRGEVAVGTDIPTVVREAGGYVSHPPVEDGRLRSIRFRNAIDARSDRRLNPRRRREVRVIVVVVVVVVVRSFVVGRRGGRSARIDNVRHVRGRARANIRYGPIAPSGEERAVRRVAVEAPGRANERAKAIGGHSSIDVPRLRFGKLGHCPERPRLAIVHVRDTRVRPIDGIGRGRGATVFDEEVGGGVWRRRGIGGHGERPRGGIGRAIGGAIPSGWDRPVDRRESRTSAPDVVRGESLGGGGR